MSKPREWWICQAQSDDYIMQNEPHGTHSLKYTRVVEYSALEAAQAEISKLKAQLWVAKDSQLRTYDGLAQKADRVDEAETELSKAMELIESISNDIESCPPLSQVKDVKRRIAEFKKGGA